MDSLLDQIESPLDLRKLNPAELPNLADELREFILETLAVKPGHLGASLGVVELTIALHYFYNTPEDIVIWDVGHQSYPHKILTGRKTNFHTLRQLGGISGFPVSEESPFDSFGTGHSSTSISAITGMAIANHLQGKTNKHVAVIGDASIVSGMALEGLNHLGSTDLDVLIILNDNSIGIDPSVGALKEHFFSLQNGNETSIFEQFGFHYTGIVDGHDLPKLLETFSELQSIRKPKLLHLKTTKGKGYANAETDQVKWHAPGKFNKLTGEIHPQNSNQCSYQQIFGETMIALMNENQDTVAITPAMLTGSNLTNAKNLFPNRVLDVGIAEQHAVTLAAGLSTQKMKPYLAIYSTFLQRAYDQVIHDVALQNLPVVFCIDRAGIVGTDGATHHGYFDISFLRSIPNLLVSSPMNGEDFRNLLYTAQFSEKPFAIRFPKGNPIKTKFHEFQKVEIGKAIEIKKGEEVALLTFGTIGERIKLIMNELNENKKFGLYSFLFCKPLDEIILNEIFDRYHKVVTFEDGVLSGGFGDAVLAYANEKDFKGKIIRKGYPDRFMMHGSIEELEKTIGLDNLSLKSFLENL